MYSGRQGLLFFLRAGESARKMFQDFKCIFRSIIFDIIWGDYKLNNGQKGFYLCRHLTVHKGDRFKQGFSLTVLEYFLSPRRLTLLHNTFFKKQRLKVNLKILFLFCYPSYWVPSPSRIEDQNSWALMFSPNHGEMFRPQCPFNSCFGLSTSSHDLQQQPCPFVHAWIPTFCSPL